MSSSTYWENEVLRRYRINEIVREERDEAWKSMEKASLIVFLSDCLNLLYNIADPKPSKKLTSELNQYIETLKIAENKEKAGETYKIAKNWNNKR